jgi:hypothetical protein
MSSSRSLGIIPSLSKPSEKNSSEENSPEKKSMLSSKICKTINSQICF